MKRIVISKSNILVFLGLVLVGLALPFLNVSAQSEDTTQKSLSEKIITIFTSNTCEFCTELKIELEKNYDSKSFVLKNIDTSEANKNEFQATLVACGKEQGSVPLFINNGTCVSGKENILSIFETINETNKLKAATEADITKADIISSGLNQLNSLKITDELAWYDYALAGFLLFLLIIGLILTIKLRNSNNRKLKAISSVLLAVSIIGFATFLYFKVVQATNLSSTGADAAGKSCLDTNTCKDWNELMEAKAKDARDRGDNQAAKVYEGKIVDQRILNAQLAAQQLAFYSTTTLADFINTNTAKAKAACASDTSPECFAREYSKSAYGFDKTDIKGGTADNVITKESELGKVIDTYNKTKLEEAANRFAAENNIGAYQNELIALCQKESGKSITTSGTTFQDCASQPVGLLIQHFGFESILIDPYTGVSVFVPSEVLLGRVVESSDECIVPTSGGACPTGTATCICQSSPERAVCGGLGQNCHQLCIATHNVCKNCSKEPITPDDIPENPEEPPRNPTNAVCQESCSAENQCSDGTSCIGGKCVNPSCEDDGDCLCNSTTPICGDGILNDSDQAPEQCELGDPEGTSCEWDSCNQNSCRCPDTNPNWDIEKASSIVCVNNNTANAYAKVDFSISATYINESSPTTVGVLERVVDRPENYRTEWLDADSISNNGTHESSGNFVSEISWDLSGTLSQFTIPSGETEVTKSDFLTYTFNIPKEYFGRYVNLVTGYPEQDEDDNSFSHTNSIYVACNVPSTASFSNTLPIAILGMFLIGMGLMFAYTQRGSTLVNTIANSEVYEKVTIALARKKNKTSLKKEKFEKDILKRK